MWFEFAGVSSEHRNYTPCTLLAKTSTEKFHASNLRKSTLNRAQHRKFLPISLGTAVANHSAGPTETQAVHMKIIGGKTKRGFAKATWVRITSFAVVLMLSASIALG